MSVLHLLQYIKGVPIVLGFWSSVIKVFNQFCFLDGKKKSSLVILLDVFYLVARLLLNVDIVLAGFILRMKLAPNTLTMWQ